MNTNYSEKTFFSSVFHFFSGTLISRFLGLGREILMAVTWGTDPLIAAFWIAFRLIFFLRRVFGETTLNMAFIPHFEMLRIKNHESAKVFFKNTVQFFTYTGAVLLLALEVLCFLYLKFFRPTNNYIIILIMILSPGSIFLILHSLNASLLNCEHKFFITSFSPSIVNIVWIAMLLVSSFFSCRTFLCCLSVVLVFGFLCQWLATLPGILSFIKTPKTLSYSKHDFGEETGYWHVFKPMIFSVLGIAVSQINSLLDMFIARFIDPIGPSFLWYANRIYQLPVGVIVVSFFSVLLPIISKNIKAKNWEVTKNIFSFSFKTLFLLMTISSVAMFLLAFNGVNLIYGHGSFSLYAVNETTFALWGYSFGLIPSAMCSIVAVLFYAEKKYFVPTMIGILTIVLNCILSIVLVKFMFSKVFSIALATSLCSWIQFVLLWVCVIREYDFLRGLCKSVLFKLRKSFFIIGLTFTVTRVTTYFFLQKGIFYCCLSSILQKIFSFCFETSIFLVFLWLFANIFNSEDLKQCFSFSFWKTKYISSDFK